MAKFTYSRLSRSKSALFLRNYLNLEWGKGGWDPKWGNYRIKVETPPLIATGIVPSRSVTVIPRTVSVKMVAGNNTLPSPSTFGDTILGMLNYDTVDEGYRKSITEVLPKMLENATTELRDAFSATLADGASTWQPVSHERLARRAAMAALGSPNQLDPNNPQEHYTKSVFDKFINSFTFKINADDASQEIEIELYAPVPQNSPHPDFVGLRSNYKGPNEILLSIMGLQIKANPGVSSSGKKMIVPVGTSETNIFSNKFERFITTSRGIRDGSGTPSGYVRKYDAAITTGRNRFIYPSKTNPLPEGVPVGFTDQIRTGEVYFQNVDSYNKRPVFWSKSREGGGWVEFPPKVEAVLRKYKFLPDSFR